MTDWEYGPTGNLSANDGYLNSSPDFLYPEQMGVVTTLTNGRNLNFNRVKKAPNTRLPLKAFKRKK